MSVIFNQQISVLRAGVKYSPYSTEGVEDWDNPQEIPVDFLVSVQPRGSTEGEVERNTVISGWWLCTPPGHDLDLRSSDRVKLSTGSTLSVEGDPLKWPHPLIPGTVHHVEANLEVTRG